MSVRRFGAMALGTWCIKHIFSPVDRWFMLHTNRPLSPLSRWLPPRLLLTTLGRKTGKAYTTPLFYLRQDACLVICNVNPAYERHNPWVLNLQANTLATIRLGSRVAKYRARVATESEVDQYWPRFIAIWPAYQEFFEQGGKRTIFVLEPTAEGDH
jgi:F420H(2)-dependent quinone reductase